MRWMFTATQFSRQVTQRAYIVLGETLELSLLQELPPCARKVFGSEKDGSGEASAGAQLLYTCNYKVFIRETVLALNMLQRAATRHKPASRSLGRGATALGHCTGTAAGEGNAFFCCLD